MKFIICNGSLTPSEESNTFTLCEMVKIAFEKLNHEYEIVTIRDLAASYDISYASISFKVYSAGACLFFPIIKPSAHPLNQAGL